MKKLFVNLIFILVTFVAHAQFPAPQPPPLNKDMIRVGKLFWLNTSDTTEFSASSYRGAIMYRAADKSLYVSDSTRWVQVASGGDLSEYMKYSDTTSLSSRIDQKLNISDTLDMLSSYLRKVDTTGKWKPLLWFPGVSEVIGLQDSLADRYTKDQSDTRYLQGNQTITLSGDVLGSGTTAISTTLKNTGTAGTYTKVTTDAQGRVTSGTQLAAGDIPNLSATYIPVTQKGAANGVATLGGDGKVTPSQLPVTGGGFLGQWNASTNTPTLADGVGSPGEYYRVSTAGTVNLGSGSQTFAQGDAVVYTAAGEWIKDPNYQAVSSVNGKVGVVVIDKSDVGLSNVDNTSDLAKPISTATQTALNGKEPTIAPGTTAQVWIGNKTWSTTSTLVRPLFSAGTGLTYNSTTGAFAANFGTTAGTVMQGNDSRVTGAVPNTRTITAGTGLTGGGDLTANRSFAIDPAYTSFTNYYTKTNLQTSGQAAVHWGNLTNVPGSFPTTSNLQTVLSNGNTATNSITLGAAGNTTQYTHAVIRNVGGTNYNSNYFIGAAGGTGAAITSSDGTTSRILSIPVGLTAPYYSPNGGTNSYEIWHSNNHPAGSAFTPTLTGANVLSSLTVNSAGHVSALTTRAMTAGDIGAAPSSGSGNYIQNISSGIQPANFRIAGHGIFYRDGSNSLNNQVTLLNAAATRGANIQLNGDATPGLATWIHSGSTWAKRQEYFANGSAAFYTASDGMVSVNTGEFYVKSGDGTNSAVHKGIRFGTDNDAGYSAIRAVRGANSTSVGLSFFTSNSAPPAEVFRISPAGAVSVTGAGTLSAATSLTSPLLTAPSGSDLSISAPASHSLFFNPGGTNRGVWDGDGRLGIGTTPNSLRASMLEVNGNVWSTDAYLLGTGSTPISEYYMAGSNAGIRTMNGTANLTFDVNQTTEVMRITPTARVGIGTSSPGATLHVNGSVASKTRLITTASPFSITDTDHVIIMEGGTIGTGGGDGVLITLPNPATNEGRELIFWEGTTSAWATNYSILRTANAPLDIIQNAMTIRVIGGQWRLISQSN